MLKARTQGIYQMNFRLKTHFHVLCATALSLIYASTARADELQLLFQKSPADGVPYLGTGNAERGVAYNPATGHVLVVSRTTIGNPGEIYILDGQTGAELGTMSMGSDGVLGGGTFGLSAIAIADDGAIYAANLTTSTTAPDFRIYRWESETADPTLAYAGDPSGDASSPRWGDSFDVRGAGLNTQFFAAAGNTASIGALFTTTDGLNFTPTIISNVSATAVAFGSGNTVWAKRSGTNLRLVSFDPVTGAGATVLTVPTTIVPSTALPIGANPASNYLAAITINAATDDLRLFDVSFTNDIVVVDQEVFPANNANANAAGFIDISGDILAAVNANNGLMVFRILKIASSPSFTTQPTDITLIEDGFGSLAANVSGTRPITFQWQQNGTNVVRGTNATLTFTNISLGDAGTYTLIASNAASAMTSNPAIVTVQPVVRSEAMTILWRVAPGTRPYLNIDNTDRAAAYNALSNHVLVVTRTGGAQIYVLDGDTGADLWQLQTPTDVIPTGASSPGGFRLNMLGVADDGAVYAANLTTGAGETDANAFRIYRWENDSSNSMPVEVYRGAPVAGRRFGDTFAVRGAGNETQILLGNNNSAAAEPDNITVIMTTTDAGLTWTPNVITTPGVDDDYFRLGIGFGSSNTFWGKVTGQPLRQVQFDLTTGTGTLLQTYSNVLNSASAVAASSNLVAVLALESPDDVRLFRQNAAGDQLTLIDQEFFATDNININGTGSADFGNDRLYVLDTNNGLLALKLNAVEDPDVVAAAFGAVSGNATSLTFTLTGTAGASYRIESTTDFSAWTPVQTVAIEPDGSNSVSLNTSGSFRFYRAVAE
jgi:hypothetical protein